MAPRGRKRKAGLKREDAARDRMRDMGFQECVINESIKELLRVYGEDHWFLIEDGSYDPLLNICLEKQEEISKQLAKNHNEEMAQNQNKVIVREQMAGEEQTNQLAEILNEDMAEDQNEVIAEEEQANQLAGVEEAYQLAKNQEEEKESETHVEDGRDQADTVSIPSEAVMDPSPAAFQFGDASDDYAPHSVEGAENTNCGWLEEEDEDGDDGDIDDEDGDDGDNEDEDGDIDDEDGDDGDNDDEDVDEIIHLAPEPLCEELEELLREVRGQKKRNKASRWDT